MTMRRHNDPLDPHERARALASERFDGGTTPDEAAWLDEHLHDCQDCRETAAAFAEGRDLLRSLPEPVPPRDLWARTSAALDRERSRGVRAAGPRGLRMTRGVRWEALAGLAVVLVVGILATRSLLPSGPVIPGSASAAPSIAGGGSTPGPVGPAATPLAVPAGDVAWVARAADGTYALNVASVTSVCPQGGAASAACAPLDSSAKQVLSLATAPGAVALAPKAGFAAVVDAGAKTTGGSIVVVPFARPAPTASPSPTPAGTSVPSAAPTASTPATPASASPGPTATAAPSGSLEPSSPAPSPTPMPTTSASPVPIDTPAPTAAALAIISDVVVVGGDAAYSPDGTWLAFSARPANGQDGPDIYVWHVGDPLAHALTADHGSVFSSWVGERILGSRVAPTVEASTSSSPDASASAAPSESPGSSTGADGSTGPDASPSPTEPASSSPDASPAPATSDSPTSFLLDPTTGTEQALVGFTGWRPVVDPTGHWMAYWTGTLRLDEATHTWLPDQGRLEIVTWVPPDAGEVKVMPPVTILTDAGGVPIASFELRWDPTGSLLGAWVADPVAPGIGRLSLFVIDPATGQVDPHGRPILRDAPALPGFSISDGRIAWATPPGQDGEGSRLQVLAWKGPDAGKTTSRPAGPLEDILVVH